MARKTVPDSCSRVSSVAVGERDWAPSEYKDKWGFRANSKGSGEWTENYSEETSGWGTLAQLA